MKKKKGFTTKIIHSDRSRPIEHGALHEPINTSVAFGYKDARDLAKAFQGEIVGYQYGRQGTPTTAALEKQITDMEDGIATASFSTGMGAISSTVLALLRAGDHIVSSSFLFGNTNSLFHTFENMGLKVSFVDATEVANVESAIKPETRMVFVETIANPRTQVADLEKIGKLCKKRGLIYFVDNTMTSPYLFLPKSVGADLVTNSLTKYIGGHGNALGGSITDTGLYDWSKYPHIYDDYKKGDASKWGILQIRKKGLRDVGATMAPEAAHHIAVGAETLAMRMERICANAKKLTEYLSTHPKVANVYYPGLKNHPQYERAKKLFRGSGGLFSFELKDGIDCFDFLNKLENVVSSSNLGDNRTLAIPVAHTIYFEMGRERRASMGISESLIRISTGIEDEEDLLEDFRQALD